MCNESHMITWWKNFLFLWKIYFMFMLSHQMVCVSAGNGREIFLVLFTNRHFPHGFSTFHFVCRYSVVHACLFMCFDVAMYMREERHSPCVLLYTWMIERCIYTTNLVFVLLMQDCWFEVWSGKWAIVAQNFELVYSNYSFMVVNHLLIQAIHQVTILSFL